MYAKAWRTGAYCEPSPSAHIRLHGRPDPKVSGVEPTLRSLWRLSAADSEEKLELASDIDTVAADSLNALDLESRLEKQNASDKPGV
jgi:hypothetical protein